MEWIVYLTGDKNDLQILSEDLKNPEFTIEKEDASYILKSQCFTSLTTDHDVREKTNEFLTILNAGIKLDLNAYEKITISHTMQLHPDGTKTGCVQCGCACVIARPLPVIVEINGKRVPENRANFTSALINLAKSDEMVAKVSKYLNQDFNLWVNLYKIYEVMEKDGFPPLQPKQKNSIYGKKASLFRRTANNPSSSGLNSRHANDDSPPENPMSLPEAQEFIKTLIHEWLKTKQENISEH
jgi:hypothetical protein